MAYIRVQNIKYDENGFIKSGSASIEETRYVTDAPNYHSKHRTKESLGKVLWINDDRSEGIFLSPERGLVHYDLAKDLFSPVERGDTRIPPDTYFPEPPKHATLGDAYLLSEIMDRTGLSYVLAQTFPDPLVRERVACHIYHGVLKDGERTACADYLGRNVLSSILDRVSPSTLNADCEFFSLMGKDNVRVSFFKNYVREMRKIHPTFGHFCLVDSTPLPNDIEDNPLNYLCSHGVGEASVQMRMVIVLDRGTGLIVWFCVIPGNVLDSKTTRYVLEDVEEILDIRIEGLYLDAGYCTHELLQDRDSGVFNSLVVRMPARSGFPYWDLYYRNKPMFNNSTKIFGRGGHTYFGTREAVEIGGCTINAYSYLDYLNMSLRMGEWIAGHPQMYADMTERERDERMAEFGFFVLLSEKSLTPAELLDDYFTRTHVEVHIKTAKGFGELLPLAKWDREKVMGKILYDIICTSVGEELRKAIQEGCEKKGMSSTRTISYILGKVKSVIGLVKDNGDIKAETINKQSRESYELLGLQLPTFQKKEDMRNKILALGAYGHSYSDRVKEAEEKRKEEEEKKAKRKKRKAGGTGDNDPTKEAATIETGTEETPQAAPSTTTASQGKGKRGRPIGSKDKKPRKRKKERVDLESNI